MQALLGQVAITYSPVIAKNRKAIGNRISIMPAGAAPISLGDLLAEIIELLPETGTYYLAPLGFRFDISIAGLSTTKQVVLEVPATALHDAECAQAVRQVSAAGMRLALRGHTDVLPPADVLNCFSMVVLTAAEDRRRAEGGGAPDSLKRLPVIVSGINQVAELDAVFRRGAYASAGWPLDEQIELAGKEMSPSHAVVGRLMVLVQQSADIRDLEDALKKDPTTGFRLLKFINSPAFGMPKQVKSFGHAIMLLGYSKMTRWLALLMATTSKDVNALPLMHSSVRRGMFMEEMVGTDEGQRDLMFITGSFSLFDRIAKTPFDRIFAMVSLSSAITDAILHKTGPCAPYLALAEAVEQNDPAQLLKVLSGMGARVEQSNRALVAALSRADVLDNESGV